MKFQFTFFFEAAKELSRSKWLQNVPHNSATNGTYLTHKKIIKVIRIQRMNLCVNDKQFN